MKPRIYSPPIPEGKESVELAEDTVRYLRSVLRLGRGDAILLFLPIADMLGGAGFYGQGHELDYRPAVGGHSRPIYY